MTSRSVLGVALIGAAWQACSLDAMPAEAPSPLPPYVDRVIEGIQKQEDNARAMPVYDSNGALRSLRLETRLDMDRLKHGVDRHDESSAGIGLQSWLETDNWGVSSIQGSLRSGLGRSRLTLRQRYIPLQAGAFAHVELGVIQAPSPEVFTRSSRMTLAREHLQGGSLQWAEEGAGRRQLMFTHGTPGYLAGLSGEGFEARDGRRSLLAAQWGGWALEHEQAQGLSTDDPPASFTTPGTSFRARSTQLGHAWEGGPWSVQLRAIRSTRAETGFGTVATSGWWTQADWKEGAQEHGAGVYRLDPKLHWAAQTMPNDLQGLYYRGRWSARQWSLEGGVDRLASIAQQADKGHYATVFGRYRLNRWHTWSAGLSVRSFHDHGQNAFVDWRWLNDLGTSGLRLEEESRGKEHVRWVRYDQDWDMSQLLPFSTLSSSVAVGTETRGGSGEVDGNLLSLGLSWALPLSERLHFRGTLGTERSAASWSQRHYNIGLNWQVSSRWVVEGYLNQSIGQSRHSSSLDPLSSTTTDLARQEGRSVYLLARYAMSAGSRRPLLGARAGQLGGGRITGLVFFDANRSANREAAESAASGVTIVLDDRYVTSTDAQGRFEYPFVAAGHHRVAVRKDSVPLPWSVPDETDGSLEVRIRGTTEMSIPFQRLDP